MFTKLSKFMSLLMMVALLVTTGAGAALAQDLSTGAGDGPGTAVSPSAGAVQIEPGKWQWYLFRSQRPVNVEETDEEIENAVVTNPEDATIDAMVRVDSGNVDFEVWSSEDLNNWINDEEFDPTGVGTINEFMNGDPLFWQGTFQGNNNYYLIVKNRGTEPAFYSLNITGDVRFPSELSLNSGTPAAPAAVAQPQQPVMSEEMGLIVDTPAASTPTEPAIMANMGGDPESALRPAGSVVSIESGKWQWYSFRAQKPAGVEETDEDVVTDPTLATIDAVLRIQSGKVDFEVWSKDDLNNWRNDEDFNPTGAGTVNEFMNGDPLSWQGTFDNNNVYYLVVKNRGTEAAFYSLNITGDVSFPSSATLAVN